MTVDELRALVLAIPGAVEGGHHGKPDFRHDGHIVVNLDEDAGTITLKLGLDEQAALVARDPEAFTLPGGWARHGWTTVSLARADNDEVAELIHQAWDETVARYG